MPTYIWECQETGAQVEVVRSMKDINIGPEQAGTWKRLIQPPAVLNRLIPSGFGIREADSKWQAGKEIAALEDSRYDMRPAERQEVNKEIKRIKDGLKK